MNNKNEIPEARLFVMWIVGSISFLSGIWIATQVEMVTGATTSSYFFALLVSVLFNMIGGYTLFDIMKSVSRGL